MYDVDNIVDKGRVIAIWSPVHRQGGVSALTALLSAYIAGKITNDKILLLSNELYGAQTAADYLVDDTMLDGLTEICELAYTENLKSCDDIYNRAYSNISNIDILYGSKRNISIDDYMSKEIGHIFDVARKGYKYILVDTVSGTFDKVSQKIVQNSDIVIVCMPQDKFIHDSWIRKMERTYLKELEGKTVIMLSGLHYEYPHMKYTSMAKELKCTLYYISLNELVHKSVTQRTVNEFIVKQLKNIKPDDVIYELEAVYDCIVSNIITIVEDEKSKVEIQLEKEKFNTEKYLENISNLYGEIDITKTVNEAASWVTKAAVVDLDTDVDLDNNVVIDLKNKNVVSNMDINFKVVELDDEVLEEVLEEVEVTDDKE